MLYHWSLKSSCEELIEKISLHIKFVSSASKEHCKEKNNQTQTNERQKKKENRKRKRKMKESKYRSPELRTT